MVSLQHRVPVRSAIAQRMFGTDEILVAARQLSGLDVVEQVDVESVSCLHLLFDAYQIVTPNGAEIESLYPGPEALKSLGDAAAEEIFTLFPELRDRPANPARPPAPKRRSAEAPKRRSAEAPKMVQRHRRNGKTLVGEA